MSYELVIRDKTDNRRDYICYHCGQRVNDPEIISITEYFCEEYSSEKAKKIGYTKYKHPITTKICHKNCFAKLTLSAISIQPQL